MSDFEDPLDLLDDDGDPVVEMCLIEEEERKDKRGGNRNSTGCSMVLFLIGTSLIAVGWVVTQMI